MMNWADTQYLNVANDILKFGEPRQERTGTGATSLFSPPKMRFDLREGFPLLTTKKLHIPSIVHELIWFIKGETDIKYLVENGIKIWNADAYRDYKEKGGKLDEEGFLKTLPELGYDLGPIYGKQWRAVSSFNHIGNENVPAFNDFFYNADFGYLEAIDQLKDLIEQIKKNPTSRRLIINAWNVAQLKKMALPPCHIFFQVYVTNDGGLILQMYQRSADWFLGVPFNIASYSLLTHMLAQVTGLYAKEFIWIGGDAHIYDNHVEQIKIQMEREPRELPTLWLNPDITDIDDFTAEDIRIDGYDPHPLIKGIVSVG